MAQNPLIYLLDEPLNHLDIKHQQQVLAIFYNLAKKQQKTIIMVLHDLNIVAHYCDHVILMDKAQGIVKTGLTQALLTEEELSKLYQQPLRSVEIEGEKYFFPESKD